MAHFESKPPCLHYLSHHDFEPANPLIFNLMEVVRNGDNVVLQISALISPTKGACEANYGPLLDMVGTYKWTVDKMLSIRQADSIWQPNYMISLESVSLTSKPRICSTGFNQL